MQTFESSGRTDQDDPPAQTTERIETGEPQPEPAHAFSANGHTPLAVDATPFVACWEDYARTVSVADERRRRQGSLRVAREVIETGILALVIFLAVRGVVQNFRVEGLSMDPTYHTGQYVLVNKALYTRLNLKQLGGWLPFVDSDDDARYLFHQPKRGEVIVFEPPIGNRGERDFIKRVIGEPGDHIVVKDGRVQVNGRQLEEKYLGPGIQTTCAGQWCDIRLGPDEYFMMGDNRVNSSDSRLWGPAKGDAVIGKAWLIYLPFSDFGPAPNAAPALVSPDTGRAP